jgi:hypothetical protein
MISLRFYRVLWPLLRLRIVLNALLEGFRLVSLPHLGLLQLLRTYALLLFD